MIESLRPSKGVYTTTYVQHGQPSRRSGGGVGECKKSSVKMKTSVKINNLDGDPKRYPVASIAATVRLTSPESGNVWLMSAP